VVTFSNPGRFIAWEKDTHIHWTGNWSGPRFDLDSMAKRSGPVAALAGTRTLVVQPVAYTD